MAYERITVIGNVGDVKFLTSARQKKFVRMTLAVNRQKDQPAVWYSVFLLPSVVAPFTEEEFLKKYYKGRYILVEGMPSTEAYQDGTGALKVDNMITSRTLPEILK